MNTGNSSMSNNSKQPWKGLWAAILYGCVWGMFELTLGGYLHVIHHPFKGKIMTAIAFAIMITYLLRNKVLWHPIVLGLVASSFKFLNVFIYSVPLLSRSIINPALSILEESLFATIGAYIIFFAYRLMKPAVRKIE